MLKLNSTGGKLDITITDDAIFGSSKPLPKQQHRDKATSRASYRRPQQKKQAASTHGGKVAKIKEATKSVRDSRNVNQTNPPAKQFKRSTGTHINAAPDQSASKGSSVISQAKLENILSLLNNGQENRAVSSSLSPEQLSVLVSSLSKMNTGEHVEQNITSKTQEDHFQRNNANSSPKSPTDNSNKFNKAMQPANSKTELKKDDQIVSKRKAKELEKQKERSVFEEYNPWGRPGAGAPVRSQSGKVLADYQHKVSKETKEISSKQEKVSPVSHGPLRSTPVASVGSSTSNVDTTLPVALRSSFAVGAPGLVANETQQKRLQEMQWKLELEKQIEEKKERERQRKIKEHQEDLLNLSWSKKSTKAVQKDNKPSFIVTPEKVSQQQPTQESTLITQTQEENASLLNQSLNGTFNKSSHARGFGMHTLDLQSQDEAEKKRLKKLEHQRAIQEQVEENRRKKQQEKEQRLKEEAIEEARLAQEREKLNQAFAIEQKRKKEKEEEAKRVSDALQQSVLDAFESSQQAKRERRKKQLEAGGHGKRGGASSRSYLVSRTSSLPQNTTSLESRLSHYTTPREFDSPRYKAQPTNTSQSRSSIADPIVPPLNIARADSPPVPTLRNKLPKAVTPRSSTTPASRAQASHRTFSTSSEPISTSMASTRKDTHRSDVENDFLTSLDELSSARFSLNEAPFETVQDAFMVPYHRTDSATLPGPPDTPQDSSLSSTVTLKTKETMKKTKKSPDKDTVPPMYRSKSTHLKNAAQKTEISPKRAKGTKTTNRQAVPSKAAPKKPAKDSSAAEQRNKRIEKKQRSPRIDAALSRLSRQQDIQEPLPTARQELILQQLAALRQGLLLKEQELKQGL